MLTANERIERLEREIAELKNQLGPIGAAMVFPLSEALEQMVDKGLISAGTRNEIWGRVRKELRTAAIGSEGVASGMARAIPHYPSAGERRELNETMNRVRRETLRARQPKADEGQSGD